MSVDLSKARKGDKISLEVEVLRVNEAGTVICTGNVNLTAGNFDIVKGIKPAPFDWSTVKPGMAFLSRQDRVRIYLGPCPWTEMLCATTDKDSRSNVSFMGWSEKNSLVRAPEHDIEVPT